MPSRLVKPRRLPTVQKSEFAIHQDLSLENASSLALSQSPTPPDGFEHLNGAYLAKTLAPASSGAVDSMKPNAATHHYSNSLPPSLSTSSGKLSPASPYFVSSASPLSATPGSDTPRMLSTIRTVPSLEGILSDTSSDVPSIATKNSALSSSITSNSSGASVGAQGSKMDTVRLKGGWRDDANGDTRPKQQSAPPPAEDGGNDHRAEDAQSQPWDSTIGKAGLGKTGRVINKLVSEKEALKRDLDIERLKAEEAKQAAKLAEDKMERAVQEYESRLLEANVTKTLLQRKERQVESLTATVELEKKKAQAALEREQTWRDEMERAQRDTKAQVEEATSHAQLMEGRYNAISSHWRDQGDEVKRAVTKLKGEISSISDERRKDDEKIATLRELCDQQDSNIKELKRQKEEISQKFEAYKRQQDDMLQSIKENARAREEEQERLLEETRETLAKLKWALNVNKTMNGGG